MLLSFINNVSLSNGPLRYRLKNIQTLASSCVFLVIVGSFGSQTLSATEVSGGIAAVDEMDDRLRPAATIALTTSTDWHFQLYLYGRSMGTVEEQTEIIGFNKLFPLFQGKGPLEGGLGASFMREYTAIHAIETTTESVAEHRESFYNLGFFTKIQLSYSPLPMTNLHIAWDSHLFLAGEAGLFLATGRKHFVSLSGGVAW